ncbi:MAG: 1-acyl-sn-glycerol-3-phosphate acyltransferase [Candidatus Azotimanducaceae bacterium]|jgi:1-acyl-sn-glycerol-3-phosphate acyltransferase
MASQFALMRQRRFAGLFYTQFFGAYNDNVFKAALSLIFVFSGIVAAAETNTFVNLAAGLFILPFFLFSATAGQIADKFEKSRLIRTIKIVEVVIAFLGGLAVFSQNIYAMLAVLFLLGVQSTFFGPLKYSMLPQQLTEAELIGGNAQIEMGTFVAILLGTIVGGVVASQTDVNAWLTAMVVVTAIAGYIASRFIPECPATDPELRIDWNPLTATIKMVGEARTHRTVFLSVLGISWFWLLGSLFLTQIPNLTKVVLQGETTVVTLILAMFTIFVAIGSLACERLSGQRIEIGIVPVGAFGLSLAGIDVYFAIEAFQAPHSLSWLAFLNEPGAFRILIDFGLVGFFGGMFIVPLYALIQMRTEPAHRARIIAVNNIINAVFMVAGAGISIVGLGVVGLNIPELLLVAVIANVVVSVFIFNQVPEFAMRFLVWLLSHTMYRVTHEGFSHIPERGGAVLVCNHVTYVDALILAGAVSRPIRFVMFKPIYDIPVLNYVFRAGKAIPIQGEKEDKRAYDEALMAIRDGLNAGDLLCIFPEGSLTTDGDVAQFRRGVERIVEQTPVPVVPLALQGLWGSFFSHSGGLFKSPKRFWSKVTVVAGAAIEPNSVSADGLHSLVSQLRGESK